MADARHTLTEGRTRNFSFALLQRVLDKDAPRPPFRTSTQHGGGRTRTELRVSIVHPPPSPVRRCLPTCLPFYPPFFNFVAFHTQRIYRHCHKPHLLAFSLNLFAFHTQLITHALSTLHHGHE